MYCEDFPDTGATTVTNEMSGGVTPVTGNNSEDITTQYEALG